MTQEAVGKGYYDFHLDEGTNYIFAFHLINIGLNVDVIFKEASVFFVFEN